MLATTVCMWKHERTRTRVHNDTRWRRAAGTCLLSLPLRPAPPLCSMGELQIEISNMKGCMAAARGKSNQLMCYMCKFTGLLLQINAFPFLSKCTFSPRYLWRALGVRDSECGTRVQHNEGEIIILASRLGKSNKGSFVNEECFILLDGAWMRLERF